jgi:hypothetical protein
MPSAQAGPSVQPLAVSQPFGPLNGVIMQGLTRRHAVGSACDFFSKNRLLICIFLTNYFCIIIV